MEGMSQPHEGGANSEQPWITFLDEQLVAGSGLHPVEHPLYAILRNALSSPDRSAIAEAAQHIDAYYHDEYLPYDPLTRFEDDKGMGDFLATLYELINDLARLIPFNNSAQDILIQLIIELRNLPPKPYKIWNEDCLVYVTEPLFPTLMEDNWNGNFPHSYQNNEWLEKECTEWVNYSAFIARCIQAGLNDDQAPGGYKYPSIDIPKRLEEDHPESVIRNCFIMVAIQYIILASPKIEYERIRNDPENPGGQSWWLGKWKIWAAKLKEIAENEQSELELSAAADKAYKIMVSLRPEMF